MNKPSIRIILKKYYENEVTSFVMDKVPLDSISKESSFLIKNISNLEDVQETNSFKLSIACRLLNDFEDIDQTLQKIHKSLSHGGNFIGKVETLHHRKKRIRSAHKKITYLFISFYEFIFKRGLPKFPGIRRLYKRFGIIKHHILSKCEILGRLRYCGFEILSLRETNRFLYFIATKNSKSLEEKPSDEILIKVPKIGEAGHTIYCYKLRTMHTYANFLHDYILDNHQMDNEGKIIDDFRTPLWGKILRKTWLDEMPQLYNILKGNLHFMGLRPLSLEYLSLYPEEWRNQRTKIKPGFVPPYYADCPKSFFEIIESEKRYYEAWRKNPFKTNFIYFWRVVWNFLSGRARTG